MAYISRAFRKMGERISHLFHRHEPLREYSMDEQGYVPAVRAERPPIKGREARTELPSFDPNAGKYKVKMGEPGPKIGQRRKPKPEYLATLKGPAFKKSRKEEEEYLDPQIRKLKKEIEDEEEKKKLKGVIGGKEDKKAA